MANEKRLIDAVRFREALERYYNAPHVTMFNNYSKGMRVAIDTCVELLDAQRTIDAVEVDEHDAVVYKLECLLCHATGGQYSKAGYSLEDMERMVTDYIEECCEEAVAEEVVHGRWEKAEYCGFVRCDQCKDVYIDESWLDDGRWKYCPNCGASMMAGERKDEDA